MMVLGDVVEVNCDSVHIGDRATNVVAIFGFVSVSADCYLRGPQASIQHGPLYKLKQARLSLQASEAIKTDVPRHEGFIIMWQWCTL